MAWLARAMVRRTRGDLAAAESDLAHILRVNPDYPEAWIERGHVHLAAGRRDSALQACRDYEKGLSLDPTLDGPPLREARARAAALSK